MIRFEKLLAGLPDGAVVALGGVCLLAGALAQGGRISARLDVLAHFAPFWLLGALTAGLYGLVFASPALRATITGLGLAGVVAAAALILPELTRPIRPLAPPDAPRQIKLIQFNVWDRNADVEATADWVAGQKPDLVLMQEVEPPMRLAMARRGFRQLHGMDRAVIFSNLTTTYAPFLIPTRAWPVLPAFSRATFPDPGGAFSVFSVHLEWPTGRGQGRQIAALRELLAHYPADRLILAGDLNLTPWSFTLRRLDEQLGLERRDRALWSWPARLGSRTRAAWPIPLLPLDHLYAGKAWRTVSISLGPRLGSDHYPIVARLALVE